MGFKPTRRGRTLAEADIARLEDRLGAKLPPEYRQFLLETNGGRVERGDFGDHAIVQFYGVNRRGNLANIEQALAALRDALPAELIPIASNAFGDDMCLAIKGQNRGRIYLWHHEGGAPVDDPWLALRSVIFPDRYPDDKPPYTRPLDWPGHPDLTLVAEDFSQFLDSYRPETPDE